MGLFDPKVFASVLDNTGPTTGTTATLNTYATTNDFSHTTAQWSDIMQREYEAMLRQRENLIKEVMGLRKLMSMRLHAEDPEDLGEYCGGECSQCRGAIDALLALTGPKPDPDGHKLPPSQQSLWAQEVYESFKTSTTFAKLRSNTSG